MSQGALVVSQCQVVAARHPCFFQGNESAFAASLTSCLGAEAARPSRQTFHIVYNEDSLKEQRQRVKQATTFHQLEYMHVYSGSPLNLPEKTRKHCMGSNKGDVLATVSLEARARGWHLSPQEKKKMYGRANRVAVGGPTEWGSDADDNGTSQRPAPAPGSAHVEPAFFNVNSSQLCSELVHSFCVAGVVDLTPAAGHLAMACICEGLPYTGVCFTPEHVELLYERLTALVLEAFVQEDSPLYRPAAAAAQAAQKGKAVQAVRTAASAASPVQDLRRIAAPPTPAAATAAASEQTPAKKARLSMTGKAGMDAALKAAKARLQEMKAAGGAGGHPAGGASAEPAAGVDAEMVGSSDESVAE